MAFNNVVTTLTLAQTGTGTGTGTGAAADPQGFDFMSVILLVLAGVMVFFVFRNSKKRQTEALKLQDSVVPGAEVMTGSGIFGTVVAIDPIDELKVQIETSPGTVLTVHRQAIAKVVTAEEVTADDADDTDAR